MSTASLVFDAALLVAWAIVNWAADRYIIEPMRLHGVDLTVLLILRWAFGIATVATVVSFTIEDVIAVVAGTVQRTQARFRRDRP